VIQAFISAEDQNFYSHSGVDFVAIARAAVTNLTNLGKNRRLVGASTITQQVAKNFLLTNEVSVERKIREALLARRIEKSLSKERILELYLNEIYLGVGSYGVAAAALNYFNKSLDELTIAEAAYLAALPKAPNNYHPVRRREAAIARRDWVIGRMLEDGKIDAAQAQAAEAEDLVVHPRAETLVAHADFFAEEVRRELARLFGDDALYRGGLSVHTTIDSRLQTAADLALRSGLIAYDRRHGYRGALQQLDLDSGDWPALLVAVEPPPGADPWQLAVVLELGKKSAEIGLPDGSLGRIPMAELRWAREPLKEAKVGPRPKAPKDVLAPGDVILVEAVEKDSDGKAYEEGSFGLRQIPEVDGAVIAMDPHSGRVLAMSGGFSYEASEFNRAIQAKRQPGSAFKPFVYLTALDNGFTPSSILLDAPIVIDQGPGLGKWKPANYTDKFYGPTPMRIGIEKSRNLMTIRLAQTVGMEKVVETAERFGVLPPGSPPQLSFALGAGEASLLDMTTAYAMLVNGGKRIQPTLIDRVQDKHGRTTYRHDQRSCASCGGQVWASQEPPRLPDERERIADPASVYQVVSMLQGVVERGTGAKIRVIGKPLAGKTGTTNDFRDAWFVGFSPDLAVGVFVGFDEPRTMGKKESGSAVAVPIWRDFMAEAMAEVPATPFRLAEGIRLVRVAQDTGLPARSGDKKVILEAFKPGTVPDRNQPRPVIGAGAEGGATATSTGQPSQGLGGSGSSGGGSTGGLY
jgi:penicillin-binding protein 1A